jgi:hypothetical protein
MPDLQAGLRTRLLANATVATAVGTRVTWVDRPQASALPAIVLQTISDPRPAHLKGHDGSRMTRVQMDVFAATYAAALSLARAAIAALKDPATVSGKVFGKTFVDGQRDLSEDVGGTLVHRQSVDLLVWHAGD